MDTIRHGMDGLRKSLGALRRNLGAPPTRSIMLEMM